MTPDRCPGCRLRGWTHDVAASQHRADLRRPLRRARRRCRHQRRGVSRGRSPDAARRSPSIDRGDFGGFTSQESSNLVWGGFKYLENYELPLVFGLCRSRNRLMKAYPDNIKEIAFLATLDERRRSARGSPASAPPRTGDRPVRHAVGRGCSSAERDQVRGAGDRHDARRAAASSTRTRTSSTTTPASSSRSCARRSTPAPRPPTTSSSSPPSGVGDRWVVPPARRRHGRGAHDLGPRDRQRRRAVRRRAQRRMGPDDRAPDRLLEGHPPRRAPPHHHEPRPRARLLRRHPATLLRDPDGPPVGHRHHRHPGRHPVHRGRPTTTAASCSTRSTPASTSPAAAHRRRHHRRALRRATARRQPRRRRPGASADWTSLEPQARGRARRRSRRRHDLRRQAHRLPQRRRGGRRRASSSSASRSSRTCTTGTASRPRRRAPSSTARPS